MRKWSLFLVLVAIACATTVAVGQSFTVSNGATLNIGVNTYGNVYDPATGTGLYLIPTGDDPIAPGSPRSAWGVSAGSTSGYADPFDFGVVNLNFVSLAATASTVTSVTQLPGLLNVNQVYSPSSNIWFYQDKVTLTNISGGSLSNVMFSQQTDWDLLPIRFNEFSTVNAWGKPNVVYTSAYGFESPDPLNPTFFCGGCNDVNGTFGPGDLGQGIIKDFGTLAPGASISFTMYYGGDTDTASLLADLMTLSPNEWFILQGNNGGVPCTTCDTFAFAISEAAVPEPSSLLLLGTGVLGLAGMARRKFFS
jgi:PEP-CTERM motif